MGVGKDAVNNLEVVLECPGKLFHRKNVGGEALVPLGFLRQRVWECMWRWVQTPVCVADLPPGTSPPTPRTSLYPEKTLELFPSKHQNRPWLWFEVTYD